MIYVPTCLIPLQRTRISLNGPRNPKVIPNYTVYVDRFTNVAWITIALSALVLALTFFVISKGREFKLCSPFPPLWNKFVTAVFQVSYRVAMSVSV